MNLVSRDPKTGRFVSTKNAEKTTAKVSPKSTKKAKGEMRVQILVNPLEVFSKKAMEGKPSRIKAGTEVQLTPVGDAIRVKKLNSSRTFYTNQAAVEAAS